MVSRQEVMSMLRRNASYNDSVGSAVGAGYIGGCMECGKNCMHCAGSGYIGGFKGENRILGAIRRQRYPSAAAKRQAIRDFLESEAGAVALQQYGVAPADAVANVNNRRRGRPLTAREYDAQTLKPIKCTGMPVGLKDFCEYREQHPGMSRAELSYAWARQKYQEQGEGKLSRKQKRILGLM